MQLSVKERRERERERERERKEGVREGLAVKALENWTWQKGEDKKKTLSRNGEKKKRSDRRHTGSLFSPLPPVPAS